MLLWLALFSLKIVGYHVHSLMAGRRYGFWEWGFLRRQGALFEGREGLHDAFDGIAGLFERVQRKLVDNKGQGVVWSSWRGRWIRKYSIGKLLLRMRIPKCLPNIETSSSAGPCKFLRTIRLDAMVDCCRTVMLDVDQKQGRSSRIVESSEGALPTLVSNTFVCYRSLPILGSLC